MGAVDKAIEAAGSQSELARILGVKPQAVQQWTSGKTKPSVENVLAIEAATGIARGELRPDIYPEAS